MDTLVRIFVGWFIGFPLNVLCTYSLWHWFLVPVGLPPVTFVHSYGILLSLRFICNMVTLTQQMSSEIIVKEKLKREGKEERVLDVQRVSYSVLLPLWILFIGYITKWVMSYGW